MQRHQGKFPIEVRRLGVNGVKYRGIPSASAEGRLSHWAVSAYSSRFHRLQLDEART